MFWGNLIPKTEVLQIDWNLVRSRLPYAYFEFNVYFIKILLIHIFGANLVPKIWNSSNSLKLGTEVDYHVLISVLMFIFSKLFSFIFLGQIWSPNLKFFRLTAVSYRGRLPFTYFELNVYFFKIIFIYIFRANLVSKSEVLQSYWNLVQR